MQIAGDELNGRIQMRAKSNEQMTLVTRQHSDGTTESLIVAYSPRLGLFRQPGRTNEIVIQIRRQACQAPDHPNLIV